jgi:hypothetical protein
VSLIVLINKHVVSMLTGIATVHAPTCFAVLVVCCRPVKVTSYLCTVNRRC